MEILMFSVNFQLNQIQNCSVQIKKMNDRIFSFQLDARHEHVPSPLDLTKILKSYHKRTDRRKFPEK